MSLSKDCFSRAALAALLLALLSGCATHRPAAEGATPAAPRRIAVLPLDNLSGGAAPVLEIRRELMARLAEAGMSVLSDRELDDFMARRRIRYVGGMDQGTAEAFRVEAGVDAVMITSLELYAETFPPRIALTTRMVATGEQPRILHMVNVAMAGDDAPGLFGLGIVTDPARLRGMAVRRLAARLLGKERTKPVELPPVTLFRLPLPSTGGYSIAVLPFLNRSGRKYAGEIVALHFLRELVERGGGNVVEPGVLREELLRYRVIMEEGVSLADAEVIFGRLKIDRLLTGTVNDYEEQQVGGGTPKLDISALLLERENRRTVWDVASRYDGQERVYLFDFGKISTASGLAGAMARGAVKTLP